jgi:hypothetical protein
MPSESKSPTVITSSRSVCLFALAASVVACNQSVHWDTNFAAGFRPTGHTVSVFGVYKNGQMSPEAWDALRSRLGPLLGGRQCEIAGGDALANEALFAAVDDYTRTNGPTEDLLAQLAPAAQGDLILVLVEAGSLPPSERVSVVDSQTPGPSPMASKGTAGLSTYAPKKGSKVGENDVLQLSASLFSVAQGRSVGLIDMQYTGDSVSEAEGEFAARVEQLLPTTTCKGWDWHTGVDPERIRKLAQE